MKTAINFSGNFASRVVHVFSNKEMDLLQNTFPFSLLTYFMTAEWKHKQDMFTL